jgi:hypothetical protein
LLTRTPPAVLQEQGVELLMALGEVPGREGDQRRQGEPEDPERRGVGRSTAVRGGEPADPSLGLILRATNCTARVQAPPLWPGFSHSNCSDEVVATSAAA